ncbi:MAG: tetratricopeptide repeat protein, partial [Proteobacteria bacterium]|nr:tetratricopeptide repeat protein [Pseudomonadota bacterium]
MAIDKNKILQNAQKLIQKQQWDKALKEYKILAEAFPSDHAVRLKIGELYSRMGQNDAAIEELVHVAESYTKTGFYSRAVAVYKQALKIDESRADLFVSLGDLYQKLQLTREATSQFRIAVNHFEKAGDSKAALDILKKMAELEPAGLGTRSKIAELNFKSGQEKEAREEFKK